ncbi:glycosyltransferase family 2 protein [Flavobacterium sp. 7A]|uniref:glycosyltransferase family 2 protein n=1 Tax=Flavobacterium sp. 7A TaxID=2940571 RepID=UPI00222605E7|nr:glycosyltransferase family 2 protein [Flavobacterium sp. 7A]MCW2120590.1 glycosyltransferase involved in cell wall biosynthesis [Flavobacterium sp. 7A]
MPLVSIIIPLYNKKKYIEKTISSVLFQSYQNFELIIVEDCSNDGSLAEVIKVNNDQIKIIKHDYNQGLSASRNTGIKNSKGNYIAFLDADDLWKPDFLEEIISLIHEFPSASIFGTNYEEVVKNGKTLLPANIANTLPNRSLINNYFLTNITQPLFCYSGICVKKEVFEKAGYFDNQIKFGEDIDFNIRINLLYKLAYSKKALVQYLIHVENQITQTNLGSKKITDFEKYEKANLKNSSLKKFLDFQRYTHAKIYKLEGNNLASDKLIKEINLSNLNWKQKILLFTPVKVLRIIKKTKYLLLIKGYRFSTYR